jgi:ABC-type proline/glycine betaine transport system permease subunit
MLSITIAEAATPGTIAAASFVQKFNDVILFPLIALLIGLALLLFVYGCFLYVINAENSTAREEGRKHIIYSIIGMFVMLTAYSILSIAANTFGFMDELNCADDPSNPGCYRTYECDDPLRPPMTPC